LLPLKPTPRQSLPTILLELQGSRLQSREKQAGKWPLLLYSGTTRWLHVQWVPITTECWAANVRYTSATLGLVLASILSYHTVAVIFVFWFILLSFWDSFWAIFSLVKNITAWVLYKVEKIFQLRDGLSFASQYLNKLKKKIWDKLKGPHNGSTKKISDNHILGFQAHHILTVTS
jgi:hypothetical protein